MGSVQSYDKCDKCGGTAFSDFDYRSFEECSNCFSCGKGFDRSIKYTEEGEAILDESGKPIYETTKNPGYGVMKLQGKKGAGLISAFNEEVTQADIDAFFKELEENPALDKERCYFTKWDEEKHELVAVYGKMPALYDEEMDYEYDYDYEEEEDGDTKPVESKPVNYDDVPF